MSQGDKNNTGIDLEDFLEFFLLDSQEQVEKLGSGLLQLERDGENIALVNELFRSAHSLKGASGTMGFTPIVELTHAAEDLLDKLRQGKLLVTNEIIDVLLAVTDKVKLMLANVEQRVDITEEYSPLKDLMNVIVETGATAQPEFSVSKTAEVRKRVPTGVDFALTPVEWGIMDEALISGKAVYQIEVLFAPNTLMKAVRAVMVIQRLEPLGRVVKILPSIEELEADTAERFHLLYITIEPPEEIRADVLEVSEISEVRIKHYSQSDSFASNKDFSFPGAKINEPKKSVMNQGDKADNEHSQQSFTAPAAADSQENGANQVHTIRVDTVRMDNLINLVGEMVITRTRLVKIGNDLKANNDSDPLVNGLNETNVYLGRLMSDLQESVMRLRMVPVGTVFSRYPRLVRDFCRKTGKKIELVVKGEETELDKTVIEMIGDPLTHIIRNSVDHGIELPEERIAAGKPEVGTITLDAYHEGNHIAITVSDNGAGLDIEKIYKKGLEKGLIGEREEMSEKDIANLIFLPGFSTADKITDISGRGVGMDVVKKALNNLGGLIDIKTKKGEGTSFIIRLPLTLAIIQALLVEVGKEIYAVPLSSVIETLLVQTSEIKTVGGLPMVQLRGNTLPLISLKEKFDLHDSDKTQDEVFVVVVGLGDKVIGLVVDELQGQQEIVIKTLGEYLNGLPGIAGATILGDGKVTLILDIGSLIQDILIN
ncbi:MAG: Chemotaxis protein CheA [Candidatus Dichloromethanomonas elyunquensis]|nr:MAG: Chemotaxis protein CheA [Candidatus Dichloromethanomonas elyunquensis]